MWGRVDNDGHTRAAGGTGTAWGRRTQPRGEGPGWTRLRSAAAREGYRRGEGLRHHDGTGTQDARLAVCVGGRAREGGARPLLKGDFRNLKSFDFEHVRFYDCKFTAVLQAPRAPILET